MKVARPVLALVIAATALAAATLAWRSPARAEPAPAVSYTLLDGRKTDTASLRGKVVLVKFWATSCTTCVAEMPQLTATHDRFKGGAYETLGVSMQYDAPANVVRFAESRRLPFGVAIDSTGEIARRFGDVQLTPTSLLIDKHGNIAWRHVGTPDFTALHALIEKLLAEA